MTSSELRQWYCSILVTYYRSRAKVNSFQPIPPFIFPLQSFLGYRNYKFFSSELGTLELDRLI